MANRSSGPETGEHQVTQRRHAIEAELQSTKRTYDPDSLGEKRGLTFDLPASKKNTYPREESMREKLLSMLQEAGKEGVDFESLHASCGFKNRKSTRDAIGLLSRKNGYGIQGTDANLRLVE